MHSPPDLTLNPDRKMTVFRSHRAEPLVEALAEALHAGRFGPLDPVFLVVESQAIAAWIGMEMAREAGIWAGPTVFLPRRFFTHVLDATLGDAHLGVEAFDRELLVWSIFDLLHELLDQPVFQPLRDYLRQDPHDLKRTQLCHQLAELFDQYSVFRPNMLWSWEDGQGGDWQGQLWRALVARGGSSHFAARVRRFFAESDRLDWASFSRGIFLFGVSNFPPVYLSMLNRMARHVPVTLFDIVPSEVLGSGAHRRHHPNSRVETEDHPLLDCLGRVGRDFRRVMETHVDTIVHETETFSCDVPTHLLGRLQRDIVRAEAPDPAYQTPSCSPSSVTINICHGAMREVELLHRHLVDVLQSGMVSDPSEIAVVAPNMEDYAPLIEAVFPRDPQAPDFVPYHLADGRNARDFPVLSTFLSVLDLVGGRVTTTQMLDLLAKHPIRRHWNLSTGDLERLSAWMMESSIRWGIDGHHVREIVGVDAPGNTWDFGLRRLFLGYAASADGTELFQDILACSDIEGEAAQTLGTFAAFTDTLFSHLKDLARPKSLTQWGCRLLQLMEDLMGTSSRHGLEAQPLIETLGKMARQAETPGLNAIGPQVIQEFFAQWSKSPPLPRRFLQGGVNIASMLSLRHIPFSVIYILGLNDGCFPGSNHHVPFDRIHQDPKPGDRNKRDDDRFLFLETLLAARRQLVISSQGMSLKDNQVIPPSAVVDDLLDCLAQMIPSAERHPKIEPGKVYAFDDGRLVCHPLHAFDRRYFDPTEPAEFFSYSPELRAVARRFLAPSETTKELISTPLNEPHQDEHPILDVSDLVRFFNHPARFLLTHRLGITLASNPMVPSDHTLTDLDALDRAQLGSLLLDLKMAGKSDREAHDLVGAMGILPWGTAGRCALKRIESWVDAILAFRRAVDSGSPAPPHHVALDLDRVHLHGIIDHQYTLGTVSCRFHRLNGARLLGLWITHLVLRVQAADCPRTAPSILVGRHRETDAQPADLAWFSGVQAPRRHLDALIDLFHIGQGEPLLFLPNPGFEFVSRERLGKSGFSAAQTSWNHHSKDPIHALAFGEGTTFDQIFHRTAHPPWQGSTFSDIAQAVFDPLLDHLHTSNELKDDPPDWFAHPIGETP